METKTTAAVAEIRPARKPSYIQAGARTRRRTGAAIVKFYRFLGPGAMISVAYIDPDNFQTDVSSGVAFEFKLLFMVLISNMIAVFLQVNAPLNPTPQASLLILS